MAVQHGPKWFDSTRVPKPTDVNDIKSSIYFFNEDGICEDGSTKRDVKGIMSGHSASQAFVDAIHDDIKDGYGFVPFIGAGFSVTAGIPMILHLLTYLQRCICMVLAVTAEQDAPDVVPRWNPRTDSWPPFIDRSRATKKGYWEGLVRAKYKDLDEQSSPHAWLYQHALGMMSEWRTALDFLSRITIKGQRINPTCGVGLEFCEPDRGIVDACFREVMRGKKPSMNHMMLAALSAVMRIDLILTTNFDGLTEMAFSELRNPLTAFDVHLNDRLPDYVAVSRTRSIVKLHGSLRSLRADFSLDGPPNAEDRAIFRRYLAAGNPEACPPPSAPDKSTVLASNHLLMLGVAAGEQRTIQFIKDALIALPNLLVYWVCYSPSEVKKVCEQFPDIAPTTADGTKIPRIRIIRHTSAGLLFLHIYQVLRKSLPTAGALFPSTTRLPYPPLPWNLRRYERNREYVNFRDKLATFLGSDEKQHPPILLAASGHEVYGVASAGAEVFRQFETTHNCVWVDMNDIHNADDLFEAFQEAAFLRLSESDWTPLSRVRRQGQIQTESKRNSHLTEEIVRIVNSSNQPWILFVNARETPGTNRSSDPQPNGWMDAKREPDFNDPNSEEFNNPKNAATAEAFRDLLQEFVDANVDLRNNRISVTVLCNSRNDGDTHLQTSLRHHTWGTHDGAAREHTLQENSESNAVGVQIVVKRIIDWAFKDWPHEGKPTSSQRTDIESRCRFVQALASMQRPRHLSVAWSNSTHFDWKLICETDGQHMDWLDELEGTGVLRRMDGGFIWFQSAFRQGLRKALACTTKELEEQEFLEACGFSLDAAYLHKLKIWNAPDCQAKIHLRLATWYRKVFDATRVAPAIFEVAEHLCWSAECLVLRALEAEKQDPAKRPDERITLAKNRIDTARELLTEHLFLIQTQGHSGATLRRLEFIRDFWVGKRRPHPKAIHIQIFEHLELDSATVKALRNGKKTWKTLDGGKFLDERNVHWTRLLCEIAKLQCTTDEVARAIGREVAEDGDAFASLRSCGVRMIRDVPLSREEVLGELKRIYDPNKSNSNLASEISAAFNIQVAQGGDTQSKDRRYEWVRWWRWCAMLGNASRSFEEASKSIMRALYAAASPDDTGYTFRKMDTRLEEFPSIQVFDDLCRNVEHTSRKNQLEALHSLEVASFNLSSRAHTRLRKCALTGEEDAPSSDDLYAAALKFATKGLELVEDIQNNGMPRIDHDFELLWCKSRLLMMAAMCLPSSSRQKVTSRHPMSFLGDAPACLNATTPDRGRADLAIVELRRAEIRLSEANEEGSAVFGERFETWIYTRMKERLNADVDSVTKVLELKPIETIRRVRARAIDALRFLDRAGVILHERRRNVFWTTWYFERRLRAISLLLWAAVFDTSAVIPYLGLESAMFRTETEPDRLLRDALRMIRVDAYRMAMVVLAYASCARATQVLLLRPGIGGSLNHDMNARLLAMREDLKRGKAQIEAAHQSRSAFGGHRIEMTSRKKAYVDKDVDGVVEACLIRIGNVIDGIEGG